MQVICLHIEKIYDAQIYFFDLTWLYEANSWLQHTAKTRLRTRERNFAKYFFFEL